MSVPPPRPRLTLAENWGSPSGRPLTQPHAALGQDPV